MKGVVAGCQRFFVDFVVSSLDPTRQVNGEEKEKDAVEQVEIRNENRNCFRVKNVTGAWGAHATLLMTAAHCRRRELVRAAEVAAEQRCNTKRGFRSWAQVWHFKMRT